MLTMRKNAGLTIAELLVASSLLAMVLVTVMTLFGQLLKSTQKNSLMSAGTFFADGVIEHFTAEAQARLAAQTDNSPNGFELPGFTKAGYICTLENGEGKLNVERDGADGATTYLYRLEAERIQGFAGPDNGQLWRVQTEVRWWQKDTNNPAKARAGMGDLKVNRTRLVYLERP